MVQTILHSDLNCFYASVEMALDPALRGRAVAVCGSEEERHGIVLAKSEKAKRAGVKTGMANWEAKRCCPELIIVHPHFDRYTEFSRIVRSIYARYTDLVEPFGMDECWIGLPCCEIDEGYRLAEEIRKTVRAETGLTVSVGVSFNKIFAKLGSDMKKPDAVTVITPENFRDKVWPLPAADLLYVGRATEKRLAVYGIHTIGDIAAADPEFLRRLLGVCGLDLWRYASGADTSRVMPIGYSQPVKSIGHGTTCTEDLVNEEEVWRVMLYLSQNVSRRLHKNELSARGVQLTVKDNLLGYRQYQAPLPYAVQEPAAIAKLARRLFHENYDWRVPVRALTVRAINLVPQSEPQQLSMFLDMEQIRRRERLDNAVDTIRGKYGIDAIRPLSLLDRAKLPLGVPETTLPGMMYR